MSKEDQEPAYIRNAAVYVFSRKMIISSHLWGDRPYGFEMERDLYGINIDEPSDLAAASYLYKNLKKEGRLNLIDAAVEHTK